MKVTYIDHMGTDLSVVNAARVSFHKESKFDITMMTIPDELVGSRYIFTEGLKEGDVRLINYLAKHDHTSPFNHTFISMRVKAPIFVARQMQKHKFMPWNEVSRRYVDDPPEFYEPEWRRRPQESVKQGSGGKIAIDDRSYSEAVSAALRAYEDLLKQDVAPEQARAVLPQNMYTEWMWSGTLGAWADMYKLRIDGHAQKETQWVAKEVGKIIQPLFPVSWGALINEQQ